MKYIPSVTALIICMLLINGCNPSDTSDYNPKEEIAKIQKLSQRFGNAYRSSNADSLANLFTGDARYATNNGFLLEGREEIRQAFRQWLKDSNVELVEGPDSWIADFHITGDMAYSLTYYNQRVFPNDTDTVLQKGYGLTVFKRQDNTEWKIKAMTVNKHPEAESPTPE